MKRLLNKLKNQGKMKSVTPSETLKVAFIKKAKEHLKAAKLLQDAGLYEQTIINSYYAMYNALQGVMFFCGIKCENHNMAIDVCRNVLSQESLASLLEIAKEERIDKQYYITDSENLEITKDEAAELLKKAEDAVNELRTFADTMTSQKRQSIHSRFIQFINES